MNMPLTFELLDRAFDAVHHDFVDEGYTVEIVHELVRRRAYELYENRGRQPGDELADWFAAEREFWHHQGA
jgi:hypothetical protein